MAGESAVFTVGVEEEYQIIHPDTRALDSRNQRVLPLARESMGDEVQPELYQSQIETATRVCTTLAEARSELTRVRRNVIEAASRDGNRIAAAGTHPFSHWGDQQVTPRDRYRGIAIDYQLLARELVIFGCHVHVGLGGPEMTVQVMNRMRPWLAALLALSANSPFWLGEDTGYASFRTELWNRWPLAGPPNHFASRAEYDALMRSLVETGSIQDATHVYWDVRLPEKVDTVECRVTDVSMTIDEAVMVAGLTRALVRTCYEQALRDEPYPAVRSELLRAAHWRAARFGLDGELIDVAAGESVPARTLVERLLSFVRPALEAGGDWNEVAALARDTMDRGTGAARQRAAYRRAGRLEDVVDLIVADTATGVNV